MAKLRNNLTSKKFGFLTVLSPAADTPIRGISRWKCQCDCGTIKPSVLYTSLVRGESKSCGQCNLVPRGPEQDDPLIQSRVGKTYGRWTILAKAGKHPKNYLARCSCGTEKVINYYSAVRGNTVSCGCYRAEEAKKNRIYLSPEPHLQHSQDNPLYAIWMAIKTRCFNTNHPSYKNYGARGITLNPTWRVSFHKFATYLGPRPSPDHTVDRIDNSGHYEPGNVHWATKTQQAANTRNNPEVSYNSQTIRLRDLADKLKIERSILRFQHIIQGLPLQEAIDKSLKIQNTKFDQSEPLQSVQKPHTSFIDHTGEKINGYTAVQYLGRKHRTAPAQWLCRCPKCGHSKVVLQTAIKEGTVRPCSCNTKLQRRQVTTLQTTQDFC